MSNLSLDQSLDDKIRAKVMERTSDVPVFENYFRRQEAISVLRADPGSGQTPGFAPRIELETVSAPNYSHLIEDPCLNTTPINSEALRQHLSGGLFDSSLSADEKVLSRATSFVDSSQGGVAIAPIEWKPTPWIEPTVFEKINSIVRPQVSRGAGLFIKFLKWVGAQKLPERTLKVGAKFVVHSLKKSFYIAVSSFASFSNTIQLIGDVESVFARKLVLWLGAVASYLLSKLKELAVVVLSVKRIKFNLRPKLVLPELRLPTRQAFLGFAGQGMIIASLVLLIMTIGPIVRLQAGEWWTKSRTAITGKAIEPQVKPALTDTVRKPEEIPPEDKQFQLLIPKLDANMKVIANVDAGDEKAYAEALKKGVAHAAGTGLPGEANATNKTVYIFGHSTNAVWNIERYNALFYSLKDLAPQDEIIVWFWGKQFKYSVTEVKKIDPKDLSLLEPQIEKDQLVLQTCWPPGTTWKRLLVVAEPITLD